jgi:hypothetical protein
MSGLSVHAWLPAFLLRNAACFYLICQFSLPFKLSFFVLAESYFLFSFFSSYIFSFIFVSLSNHLIWTLLITIYAPMIYMAPCVMLLMQAASIARYQVFWAPNGTRLSARCHFTGPKNSRLSGPNPLPLDQVMDAVRIKSITHGPYES